MGKTPYIKPLRVNVEAFLADHCDKDNEWWGVYWRAKCSEWVHGNVAYRGRDSMKVACRTCNRKKSKKTLLEFMAS